jgi:hypothetical protein
MLSTIFFLLVKGHLACFHCEQLLRVATGFSQFTTEKALPKLIPAKPSSVIQKGHLFEVNENKTHIFWGIQNTEYSITVLVRLDGWTMSYSSSLPPRWLSFLYCMALFGLTVAWVVLRPQNFGFSNGSTILTVDDGGSSHVNVAGNQSKTTTSTTISTTTTVLPANASNQSHYSSITLLDLFDWETASIRTIGRDRHDAICQPPDGTPNFCCLGTFSKSGKVCFGGKYAYDKVRQQAIDLFDSSEYKNNEEEEDHCDICLILNQLYQHQWTLSFWGDSVQRQVFLGFLCEASRRHYRIEKMQDSDTLSNCTKQYDTATRKSAKYCLRSILSFQITAEEWEYPVQAHFYFQYQPNPNVTLLYEQSFRQILDDDTQVLFWNFGLHYSHEQREQYASEMTSTLRLIQDANLSLSVFRGTSAQHFNTPGGEYQEGSPASPCMAQDPNHGGSELWGWRDRVVEQAATALGIPVVVDHPTSLVPREVPVLVLVDFFNFTSPLYELHPDECSHNCNTPFLWYPLWRSLRLALVG